MTSAQGLSALIMTAHSAPIAHHVCQSLRQMPFALTRTRAHHAQAMAAR
jgi:hypothetical protein